MDKKDIIDFFDRLAPQWDEDMIRSDDVIGKILDGAGVKAGASVLDVACGTGVLFGDYLKKNVSKVTAVDISQEMVKIAQKKFPKENIRVLCTDIEAADFQEKFDCIMVYNAFPHFPDPENLISRLAKLLTDGGTLTVAHGMSREKIDSHHKGAASKVSLGLMHEDKLSEIMEKHLTVTVKISNHEMYQVTAKK